ncbi:MAG: caspase family protein [Ferruginibacter sp.]
MKATFTIIFFIIALCCNAQQPKLMLPIGHISNVTSVQFSNDGKKIVTASVDIKIWNAGSGVLLANLKGHSDTVNSVVFSPDGTKIVTSSNDRTAIIWDLESGALLADLKGHSNRVLSASFSPDGKKIVTASIDGPAKIWDAGSGALLANFTVNTGYLTSASFSPDGKKIVTASIDGPAKIWDAGSWALLANFTGNTGYVNSAVFSPDGKKIVTASYDGTARIWDVGSGTLLADLIGHSEPVLSASFSPDGKKVVTASEDSTAKIWDAVSGTLLANLKGHSSGVKTASFFSDGRKIVTSSYDHTVKIWNFEGKCILTLMPIDSTDYLIVDAENHYDGTPAARNLLYYTCGTEIIGLDQVKDKLWVPNLAERIMKGEKINAPSLADLDICGLTPVVEAVENETGYQFKITPRRGGLGETILYVNGIETKKYKPEALTKKEDGYELSITKQELSQYFISGKENEVSVKAYTKENDISSRGIRITNNDKVKDTIPPNLYAVIIGVSDYKGNELHLSYAAKDASDIGNAVRMSASKLLGKAHVFMYNLNTGKEHYAYPEKKSIKDVFTEIGKKATANDVLMVFFAGHGVVMGEKKQFYFLTADASNETLNDKDVKDVGIGATELMEWMKPDNIKAQKRILILDACNSGQAINQIVKDPN